MRMQRPVALRADGGGERMVVGLGVVADTFTFFSTNHSPADGTKPGARQK
jgi:hypothetical protein